MQADPTFIEKLREAISYEPLQWWHIWTLAGIAACIVEMLTPGFVLLCIGLGCFVTAICAALGLEDLKIQLAILSGVTLISFFLVRPFLLKVLLPTTDETNVDALAGSPARVIKGCAKGEVGTVRIGSEEWRADPEDGAALEEGETVTVVRIEGNRAIVTKN